jgi:hypothetical protein
MFLLLDLFLKVKNMSFSKSAFLLTIFAVIFFTATFTVANAQKKSSSGPKKELNFPKVKGKNLLKRELNLPQDFGGELNIAIIAFDRDQQGMIDEWIPEAKKLRSRFPQLKYYEIPTIRKLPGVFQSFINNGMRKGIPDEDSRESTITIFLNKKKFLRELGIADEKKIYIFLVNKDGKIFGKWEDKFTQEKFAEVEKKVGEFFLK